MSIDNIPKVESSHISNDHLMQLMKLHNDNRIDYNTRKWETLKFFQTVVSALLAVNVAAVVTVSKPDYHDSEYIVTIKLIVCVLALVGSIISYLAINNLSRESELLFFEELQIFKIAKLMGLNVELSENLKWLPADKYFLSDKWSDYKFGLDKKSIQNAERLKAHEWVKGRMANHKFFDLFKLLFVFQIIAALAVAALSWLKL